VNYGIIESLCSVYRYVEDYAEEVPHDDA